MQETMLQNALSIIESRLRETTKEDFDKTIARIKSQEKEDALNAAQALLLDCQIKGNFLNLLEEKEKSLEIEDTLPLIKEDFEKIYSKSLGRKNKISLRERKRLSSKKYLITHNEGIIGYKVNILKKGVTFGHTFMTRRFHPKGNTYFFKNKKDIYAVRAHFFDRLSQRAYDNKLSREEAVKYLLFCLIDLCAISKNKLSKQMLLFLEKGIGIGRYTELNELNNSDDDFICELITFINYDMMNEKQMIAALHIICDEIDEGK